VRLVLGTGGKKRPMELAQPEVGSGSDSGGDSEGEWTSMIDGEPPAAGQAGASGQARQGGGRRAEGELARVNGVAMGAYLYAEDDSAAAGVRWGPLIRFRDGAGHSFPVSAQGSVALSLQK
jgi:hypothetical protein